MNKFLWGSATAAYQCEGGWKKGGKGMSNWDTFCHSEKNVVNSVTGDVASDHYHHYEEDILMLAKGNQNAYRFSIAWTRILPNGTGERSSEGIAFYHRILDTCKKYHIEPLVTLYHYDLPQGLFANGGWENRETAKAFVKYAKVCFEEFGDKVNLWATINEPNYETFCCYGRGNYPPNVQDLSRRWRAMYHLLLASAGAIDTYKEMQGKGQIGIISDSYSIETLVDTDEYRQAKHLADLFYNRCVNDVCVTGVYSQDFINKLLADGFDLSYMLEQDKEIFAKGTIDYLGINAYDRTLVKPYLGGESVMTANNIGDGKTKNETIIKGWFALDDDPVTEKNAWGCELYPKAVYNLLIQLKELYPMTPIIITENGLGYYDKIEDGQVHDTYRVEFLNSYVEWIKKAIQDGCNIRGYFVWSTMDLYSWINGYEKRYGLVYVDFNNENRRIPKDSYYWYKEYIMKEGKKFYEKI